MINIDPSTEAATDLEAMAETLERSGAYRVLRRLAPVTGREPQSGMRTRMGLFVDTETTGLDPARDEIIELAMLPFTYGLDGEIYGVGEPFQRLRQPSKPIPSEITAITGIDDKMVEGHAIDPAEVAAFAAPAALVIAHNAVFDRKFLERYCETFNTKPWACSMSQVDWAGEGYEGTKLAYLAAGAGFFYERHRAARDCLAAVELLARRGPVSGRTGLAQLLERARAPTWRIWAENSPFDLKDVLKARGYRWNGESTGAPRAWFIDVAEGARAAEEEFLRLEIYRGETELLIRRVDAFDRFQIASEGGNFATHFAVNGGARPGSTAFKGDRRPPLLAHLGSAAPQNSHRPRRGRGHGWPHATPPSVAVCSPGAHARRTRLGAGLAAAGPYGDGRAPYDTLERRDPEAVRSILRLMQSHPDRARFDRELEGRSGVDRDRATFEIMARWPDDIRRTALARPTWHYSEKVVSAWRVLLPFTFGDALPAFARNWRLAHDPAAPAAERAVALCWIMHIVGDMHEPLHAGLWMSLRFPKTDRAGTIAWVRTSPAGEPETLHIFWDSVAAPARDAWTPAQLTQRLESAYPDREPDVRFADPLGALQGWTADSRRLARYAVYEGGALRVGTAPANAVLLPRDYMARARLVAEAQLASAGYRIGDLLVGFR